MPNKINGLADLTWSIPNTKEKEKRQQISFISLKMFLFFRNWFRKAPGPLLADRGAVVGVASRCSTWDPF